MKRAFIVLITAVVLMSCVEPEDQRPVAPDWIRGEWGYSFSLSGVSIVYTYTFTEYDCIQRQIINGSSDNTYTVYSFERAEGDVAYYSLWYGSTYSETSFTRSGSQLKMTSGSSVTLNRR
jgi:hypothetical protein